MTILNLSSKARLFLLPFIAGTLYAMGFPSKYLPNLFIFPIIGFAIYLFSLDLDFNANTNNEFRLRPRLISFLSFSIGFNVVGFYWIPYTLSEFGNIVFPFNHLLSLLFSLIILPQHLFFILIIGLFKKFKVKSSLLISTPSKRILFYASLLSLLEYFTPQQFPAHVGHTWLNLSPNLGLAQYFGVVIFSFFSYWLATSFSFLVKERRFIKTPTIFFIIFFGLNFQFPIDSPTTDSTDLFKVRIVQPNIGNFLKISSEKGEYSSIYEVLEYYKKLSISNREKVNLIIWPETAYPTLMNSQMMFKSNTITPPTINEVTGKSNTPLFTGGYDRKSYNDSFFKSEYNSAFLFNTDGTLSDVYHKRKLIPFGESLPFGPFNEFFSKIITNISFFAEGDRFTLFKIEDISFISAICYEILFPSFIRDYLNNTEKKPNFIINLTNDSWYGDTSEPLQHLFLAKWRAIEFNIPIIRSTNTGITSILYEDGSESKRIGVSKRTSKTFEIPIKKRKITIYQRYGIFMPILLMVFIYILSTLFEMLPFGKSRLN